MVHAEGSTSCPVSLSSSLGYGYETVIYDELITDEVPGLFYRYIGSEWSIRQFPRLASVQGSS